MIFPNSLYFGRFANMYDQFSSVVVFPDTTCSTEVVPPFNTYLMLVGLFPFTFELSSQFFVTATFTFSSGTLNVFVTVNPDL